MMFVRKKMKKREKLNLIPILDSVFIFIFFLLMSAQFLEIYEIGSDAPAVKTTESLKDDKPPLNLTLEIKRETLVVKTGMPEVVYKEIRSIGGEHNLDELNKVLVQIKQKNGKESSIILRPDPSVNYRKIVEIMDTARELRGNGVFEVQLDGKKNQTRTLFNQIIFETII